MSENSQSKIFYVYVDYRLDTEKPFYVGKGIKSRAASFKRRNKFHAAIVNKHGARRDIVLATLDESFAFSEEVRLIKELKTRDTFGGANFTDGGEGTCGRTGHKRPDFGARSRARLLGTHLSEEQKKHLSEMNSGKVVALDVVERIRRSLTGKRKSSEHCESIRQGAKDRKRPPTRTPEHRAKHTAAMKGKKFKSRVKGRSTSPETREKIRLAALERWRKRKEDEQARNLQISENFASSWVAAPER